MAMTTDAGKIWAVLHGDTMNSKTMQDEKSRGLRASYLQEEQDLELENFEDFEDERRFLTTRFIWEPRGGIVGESTRQDGARVGLTVALAGDGSILAIGAPGEQGIDLPGTAHVYQYTGTWNRVGQVIQGRAARDGFGTSIAISEEGLRIAVGAPQTAYEGSPRPPGYTQAYRLDPVGNFWNKFGQELVGQTPNDAFGSTIAFSTDGNVMAIGAPGNRGTSRDGEMPGGQVQVYAIFGTSTLWVQRGVDIDGDGDFHSASTPLALSGDGTVVALGGRNSNQSINRFRVFAFDGVAWNAMGDSSLLDGEASMGMSVSVALSEDGRTLAVTDPDADDPSPGPTGRVRVYDWNVNNNGFWDQVGGDLKLGAGTPFLGTSLDLSSDGQVLALGIPNIARGNRFSTGEVRIYGRDASNVWQRANTDIKGDRIFQQVGASVALSSDGKTVAFGEPDLNGVGGVQVFVQTDRTPAPTTSPAPTPVPTAAPTAGNPFDKFRCFAGNSKVQVQDRPGWIPMQDLQIGNAILVGAEDTYEQVYSFGHKLPAVHHHDFLEVSVVDTEREHSVTLTPDHMIFVGPEGRAVPASLVEIGQEVQLVRDDGSDALGTVHEVTTVTAAGLYAPFTPSGSLLVDGIRVSAFTSAQGTEMVEIWGVSTGVSHQWLDRTLKVPHRIWCHDLGLCPEETYVEDGMSSWMVGSHDLYQWWSHQSVGVQTVATVPFVAYVSALACLDAVTQPDHPVPSLGLFAVLLVAVVSVVLRRHRRWATRNRKQSSDLVM